MDRRPRFSWLASYPKSGNTWVRLLLESLLTQGRPVNIAALTMNAPVIHRQEFEDVFGMDVSILTDAEIEALLPTFFHLAAGQFNGPLILRKVHDRFWRTWRGDLVFPPELSLGAVYIVRDPRDVAVSAAHYYAITVDESIERLGDSKRTLAPVHERYSPQLPQPLGSWSEHVVSWLDSSEMPILLVRYEDLQADAAAELRKIAAFLGISAQFADEAAAASSFRSLQAQEQEKGFQAKRGTCKQFFRKGCVGEWKEVLSCDQVDRLHGEHGTVMRRLSYL